MNKKNFFKNRKSFQKTHTEIRNHIFKKNFLFESQGNSKTGF